MLDRGQRDIDAGEPADGARPLAGADDELFAGDAPGRGDDGAHRPVLDLDAGDRHAFPNRDAFHPRALGERRRDVGGRRLPVGRQERRADDVVDLHQRPEVLRLLRRQELHFESEGTRRRRLALHLGPPLRVAGQAQAAVALPAGRLAGLGLEPVVQGDGIAEQLGDVGRGAELPDQPRRVPGRARGQLAPLDEQHVGQPHRAEMIGDRRADDSSADNHDLGRRRQFRRVHVGMSSKAA